jgi:nitrogen-specific signal transduction histidine kinase/CheY-like chemotaxis protein
MLVVTWGLGLRMARDQLQVEGLERRLARSRQLESLGQLAGGVAHDFNNVLAAVVGFGELARDEAPPHSRQARHLDQVLQAAERGRQQVERILGFSRGQARRSVVFALQPVVQEVLDHLAASMRPEVQLQPTLQAAAQGVRGDPTATYEAVMNLCTNALQAMPAGGRLAVQLQALHVAAALQTYDTSLAPGHYLCLQVRDTGQGMSTEVLAHLFEPFFTTKGRQGGTGIGLAVVHGVVADLGGGIQVQSKPGHGTTFTLWLPVAAEQAPASAPALPPDEEPRGQGQVVLVVDDEPALVELAEEMLAALGYEPLGTVSSEQALQAVRDDPARFDLLLTDEVMPGLTGTALARAVHALRPGLPVLLASGYGGEHFEGRAAEAGVQAVLAKPLGRRQLAQAVHAALQAA